MRIIHIRPSQRFPRYWEAAEGQGVQPAYRDRNDAISYAKGRFDGSGGEIHVYDYVGKEIIEKIAVDGGSGYGQRTNGDDPGP
jgi:hypothetical protein